MPATANRPSPKASSMRNGPRSLAIALGKANVTTPAPAPAAIYLQSVIATGGTAPRRTSRSIPPPRPLTNATTATPKISRSSLIASTAPVEAKTITPLRSR